MRFGDRTIRVCVGSKGNTTQAASSSRTTASAARIGPPMGSPGDETGLCDVRLQRSVAIDRFRRAAAVERQILTPRDAPSSFAAVATSPVGLRLPARDIDAFELTGLGAGLALKMFLTRDVEWRNRIVSAFREAGLPEGEEQWGLKCCG